MGVVGGGEAFAAAQLATGGRNMRHDRRCFGWLEQEDQKLKKHYGRWMDIVRSLELESFILTKSTKPFGPVNLIGPQDCLPPRWVPASRGSIHFLCVIRRHFRWVRADSGGIVFFVKYGGQSGGSQQSGGNDLFHKILVARPVGPNSEGGNIFFTKYGGPSGGSLRSAGG